MWFVKFFGGNLVFFESSYWVGVVGVYFGSVARYIGVVLRRFFGIKG